MRRVFKWLGGLVLLAILVGVGLSIQTWFFRPLSINVFYARVFVRLLLDDPELATSLHVLPAWLAHDDALTDMSPEHAQQGFARLRATVDTLHGYDRAKLAPEAQISYDVMDEFLSTQLAGEPFERNGFPVNQLFGVQSTLPSFMVDQHQVHTLREARDYVARLNGFQQQFEQVIAGLRLDDAHGTVPPQFLVEEVLQQMRAFIDKPAREHVLYTSFSTKLDKLPAGMLDDATRSELLDGAATAIDQRVYPGYRELIAWFAALQPKAQGNFGAWHLPDGDAYYAWCVRMHTTTTMSPAQLHQLGLDEVSRITPQLDTLLRKQGYTEGSVGVRIAQLAHDPAQLYPDTDAGRQQILADFQVILDQASERVNEVFDIRPKDHLQVQPVPIYAQATAPGAYYQGAALDSSRPGTFYVNLRNVGETPKFAMRTLAYHEGIPGHHFQISIAAKLHGLPFFRGVIPFTAYQEGWALYAERLGSELGLEDELSNIGRLRDEMMRAVRLVVDTGIHHDHWTREQAIDYMSANTGMADSEVKAEIERYFVDPGQALAYKAGQLEILALREKAQQALGTRFDLKAFHDVVLTHGALPLDLLAREVDTWIAAGGGVDAAKPVGN